MSRRPTAFEDRKPTPDWQRTFEKRGNDGVIRDPASFSFEADGDSLAGKLPPLAARKLAKLRREHDELLALLQSDFSKQHELLLAKNRTLAEIRRLGDPRSGGSHLITEDHPSLVSAQSDLAQVTSQLETLKALQDERTKRNNALSHVIKRIESYAAKAPNSSLTSFEPPEVEINEPPALALERTRTRLRERLSDLEAVKIAPPHSDIARSKGLAQIEALAKRGRIDFGRLIETGGQIRFPEKRHQMEAHGFVATEGAPQVHMTVAANLPDTLAILAYLQPELLIAKMEEAILAEADDSEALTDAERAARIAELKAELLILERTEEAFIEFCGPEVVRRGDADPRAVLGVSGPEPSKGAFG